MGTMTRSVLTILVLGSALLCAQENSRYRKIALSEYREKVYSSWLGQIVGNIYGLPHENKYRAEPGPDTFPYGYGANIERARKLNGAFSDDDTDIEYVYLLAMEKYGVEPAYEQLAAMWRYHIRDRVWLANRAAVAAMHHGLLPPLTGRKPHNPHWFQIDPQLINEIWSVTAPGMVRYAAAKSAWAAQITSADWGIEPTIHYGAMYAAAFFETDVRKLIEVGNASLPAGSRFRRTVHEMVRLYQRYPNDWKKARAEMAEEYWLGEPETTRSIWNANLNGAAGILALLYGQGDFQKTLDYACAIGFDADNQAASMSGLIGLLRGTAGIPRELLVPLPEWKEPFNDRYVNATRYDMPDASIRDMALRMARLGERLVLARGGRKMVEGGVEYLVVDTQAEFRAPLEIVTTPTIHLIAGRPARHPITVVPAGSPVALRVSSGTLPEGLRVDPVARALAGTPASTGVSLVSLEADDGGRKALRTIRVQVTGPNLAPLASEVIAPVKPWTGGSDSTAPGDIPAPWLSNTPETLRDGKLWGDGQSYIAPLADSGVLHFGYRWKQPQSIGMLRVVTGVVGGLGGVLWMDRALVEYLDEQGSWLPVLALKAEPSLPPGTAPVDKPHHGSYVMSFAPVKTTGLRLAAILPASDARRPPAASVAELEVY